MKVTVDMDMCEDHGQCVLAAPTYFQFDDDGNLQYQGDVPEADRALIVQAADACPVQAIPAV